MKKLDVAWIISVSAVGSLQAKYRPCDIVLPNQFFDRTKQSLAYTFFLDAASSGTSPFADPICEELRKLVVTTARSLTGGVHDGGTYVNIEGPPSARARNHLPIMNMATTSSA